MIIIIPFTDHIGALGAALNTTQWPFLYFGMRAYVGMPEPKRILHNFKHTQKGKDKKNNRRKDPR